MNQTIRKDPQSIRIDDTISGFYPGDDIKIHKERPTSDHSIDEQTEHIPPKDNSQWIIVTKKEKD